MTPSAHATAASDLLALNQAAGADLAIGKNARLAAVHAVLSTKAGTGTEYTTAETELATATLDTAAGYHLDRALAWAQLAAS